MQIDAIFGVIVTTSTFCKLLCKFGHIVDLQRMEWCGLSQMNYGGMPFEQLMQNMGSTNGNNVDGLLDDNDLVILENLACKGLDKRVAEGLDHMFLWILEQVPIVAINLPRKRSTCCSGI